MYLTDLAFIEEGTPNYTEDGLVNFSKMRMVSLPAPGHRAGQGRAHPRSSQGCPRRGMCLGETEEPLAWRCG